MRYKELALSARESFLCGINTIVNHPLPSIWDDKGIGWHEQWMNADYSGVYAGCEGIILLSQANQLLGIDYDSFITSVYDHNLCHIFDTDDHIENDDPNYHYKTNQREKAINAAYKLSKFLWASSYIKAKNNDLECNIANRLYSFLDTKQRLFKSTYTGHNGRILATVFAFISLIKSNHIRDELRVVESFFFDYLNNSTKIDDNNVDDIVFIVWAVSQTLDWCSEELISKCCDCFSELVNNQNIKQNLIVGEKYNIRSAGIRDSFNINKYFVFLQAIESFVLEKKLSIDYLKSSINEIIAINSCVRRIGVYSRNGNKSSVLFWENYYALQLLLGFYNVIINSSIKEEEFMIVAPKFFKGEDYTVDNDLCVVIMPFKTDWSKDMYDTFKEAASKFVVWRSDEEYTDDIIIQTVWEKINRAKFIIADCTGKNPNVFYELGIAHTIGKPVFMCAQNITDFPFDINHIRHFVYGTKPGEIRSLKNEIGKFIDSL